MLTALRIEGTSIAPAALAEATKPFVGQTIDSAKLGEIANAVAAAYQDEGSIALYTVTVPQQDFAGGVLRIAVTEGYIEHVDIAGDTSGDVSRIVSMAQNLTTERPLRRATLERYLSLIRDLPGLTLDAQLVAGGAPGATKLVLTLKRAVYKLAFTLTDTGNSLLGRDQLQADLSLYNLLRDGEETTLSVGTSTAINRYQYYAFAHSEALDDEGTRVTLAYGYLHTRIPVFALDGTAQTAQLALSYPVIRSYDENLSLVGSLDGIDSSNALLGQLVANEHIRALRISAGYSLSGKDSVLVLNGSMNFGLDVLGAGVGVPGSEDLDFKKLVLQARYNYAVDPQWTVRLHAATQIAFDRLPVSELFALGGPDFGRAFLQASALGDSAAAGSVELGYAPPFLPDFFKGTEVFVFADDASAWYKSRLALPGIHYDIASAGLGIRFPVYEKLHLELQGANALASNVPFTHAGEWRFLFALTASTD